MANRIVLGVNGADWVARISKPGIDVLTNTDLSNFWMHEDYYSMRILQTGTVAFGASATVTITYPNRGYIPIILCYLGTEENLNWPVASGGNAIGVWRVTQEPTASSCTFTRHSTSQAVFAHYMILPLVN